EGEVAVGDIVLELSDSSTAALAGSARDADLRLRGTSQLKTGKLVVSAQRVRVTAEGGSSAEIRGTARAAVMEAKGASHLRLGGLVAEDVLVRLREASHASVHATAKLAYDLSVASHLDVQGAPAELAGKATG